MNRYTQPSDGGCERAGAGSGEVYLIGLTKARHKVEHMRLGPSKLWKGDQIKESTAV